MLFDFFNESTYVICDMFCVVYGFSEHILLIYVEGGVIVWFSWLLAMCPPATTPDAIGLYWTDEQIISLLEKVKNGSLLPNNVSEDINPYRCLPSNLQRKYKFHKNGAVTILFPVFTILCSML